MSKADAPQLWCIRFSYVVISASASTVCHDLDILIPAASLEAAFGRITLGR